LKKGTQEMSYISLSDKDKKDMLKKIGISSLEDLFQSIPEGIKLSEKLSFPPPLDESELVLHFENLAKKNSCSDYLSFLGAGAYPHLIPYVVDYLSSRGEFVSPYTPYQPEVSQGTLQVIFEFQTLICQLTGMDISNASLYDGASGTAEAVLMASRLNRKSKVLVARTLHPQYKRVIQTYVRNLGITIEEIAYTKTGEIDVNELKEKLDENTAAVVVQNPNFFGILEDQKEISRLAHEGDALFVVSITEPLSLGVFEPPGKFGADIVTGEAQSFGIPLSFGGPYLGFMACKKEFIRQFPGRIAGQTSDVEGKTGYVLTLSTREQHIRRERATSNICTNQAWCALRATIFLETLGQEGLRELALHNIQKANYALEKMSRIRGVKKRFAGNVFNEFVLEFSGNLSKIEKFLLSKQIISGLNLHEDFPELENCILFCVTEIHKKESIDRLAVAFNEILKE
jgi:glycine dehydrogenase subunit 1